MVGELLELLPLYETIQLKVKNDKEKTEKKQTLMVFKSMFILESKMRYINSQRKNY
jgi:hypothetical protein